MEQQESKSPLVFTLLVILILIAAVGYYFLFSSKDTNFGVDEDTQDPVVQTTDDSTDSDMPVESTDSISPIEAEEFNVDGMPFSFSVKEMRVKEGDTVRVIFNNKEGMHDWVLDEFNAKTKVLATGQSEVVEFVASKKGTFEYYCSVGNHRQQGMVGKLIVE